MNIIKDMNVLIKILLLSTLIIFLIVFFASPKGVQADSDLKFSPSYISIKGHKKISAKDWTDPEICGQCHKRQYNGWKSSMHANSFKDPVFQALWAIGEKATKGKTKNHCAGCHSPIGTVTDAITFNPNEGEHGSFSALGVAAKGVSCDVCHTISDTNLLKTKVLEHGNSSFEMDPGPIKRATLKDANSPFHATEYSELHNSSKFCANCHNIFHPDNDFPVERTYDEWKYSIYAQNDIQCMDCHMVPVDVAIKVADTLTRPKDLKEVDLSGVAAIGGPVRPLVHDHAFVGGNAAISSALGGNESINYKESIKRLQNVASLEFKVSDRGRGLQQVTVKVNNDRAGHNLPTSLTEVRQVWLEVIVADDQGRELLRSGTLDKETGDLPKGTTIFNVTAVDKDGKHTEFPWEITRFTSTNTIPPRGYKKVDYAFSLFPDSHNVKVQAILHYRSFSQHLADFLLGKGAVKVPDVEMVTLEKEYAIKDNIVVDKHQSDEH